jgi:hypothetical protein
MTATNLRAELEQVQGMQAMLDRAAEWLGNPLVLFDTSYTLLAHTHTDVTDDPLWNELLKYGSFTHETVDFFNHSNFIAAVAESDVVALLQSDQLSYDRACGKFFDPDGVQLGAVTVVACHRPFYPSDFADLAVLCECIAAENAHSHVLTERVFREPLISDLLDGKQPNVQSLAALEQSFPAYIYAAVADISLYDPTLLHLAYLRDLFMRLLPEARCFLYLNSIVVLVGSESASLRLEVLTPLATFCEKYNIYAGVSNSFTNLRRLRAYYRQAISALNHGLEQPLAQRIYRYAELAMERLIDLTQEKAVLEELCGADIRRVQETDPEGFLLLHAYLLHAMCLASTAAQLHLTEAEAQARLDRIAVRLGLDWGNGNQLASLLLSIKYLLQ